MLYGHYEGEKMCSETDFLKFFKYLAQDKEAERRIDKVFENCESESCKSCVESKLNSECLKFLFGIRKKPLEIAEELEKCLR